MDVVGILNQQFQCTGCRASDRWAHVGKPDIRQNSEIHRLVCAQCGERVVAKVNRGQGPGDDGRAQALREFETLRALQMTFPQDGQFGTLVPLGYLEAEGCGVMITRLFLGIDLARHARTLTPDGMQEAFRCAGAWLRTLHRISSGDAPARTLDVEGRLEYLERTYGNVLHADRAVQDARGVLERSGRQLATLAVPAVRIHGDFKAENLLCDGVRFVGLDIHLTGVGAGVYDLAPFLNHAWFACRRWWSPFASRRYERARTGFLAGYGDVGDMRALQWVQLYFALCHLGGYRRRGALASRYANWKVWPLVHLLARNINGAA